MDSDKIIFQNNTLLDFLRFYKAQDKLYIAKKLNISMPTLYKALENLKEKNIVIDTEKNFVDINKDYGVLVGISIGASLCKLVFLHYDYTIFSVNEFSEFKKSIENNPMGITLQKNETDDNGYICFRTPTETFEQLKDFLDFIFEKLTDFIQNKNLNVVSIGISCTGIINESTKTIVQSHNLNYLTDRTFYNLIFPDKLNFFESRGISLSFMQNSNASAIAEKVSLYLHDSLYKSKKNIVSLYYGTGTGAGFILNNKYFNGTSGFAGEIGHVSAPKFENATPLILSGKEEFLCTCGNYDCYDNLIRLDVFGKNFEDFSNYSSLEIYNHLLNNSASREIIGFYFGNMINMITSILNIDLIIFTGKIAKSMPLILNYIIKTQDRNPLKFSRNDCSIETSMLGSLSPSVGAAIYSHYEKFNIPCQWDI